MRAIVSVSVTVLSSLLACSARPVDQDDGSGGGGSSGVAEATSLDLDDGPVLTTSPATTIADSGSDDVSTDEGVVFLADPDAGGPPIWECHLHAQDCDRGFKCVPVTYQSYWDGTACVPVVEQPQGIGDPCLLEDPSTGVDDCGFGQFCWATDEMGMGECIGLCLEDEPDSSEYTCEDPSAEPSMWCENCLCICMPQCDPLLQDCGEGQACYPIQDGWQCAPDDSDGAGQDSPCEYITACAPGTICVDASFVPTCEQASTGCCTAVCDLGLPDTCPGQELGMECTPWYEDGAAPPGLETVGACGALP